MTKLEIAKQIIKQHFKDANCGLYDTRNFVGDPMTTVYSKDGLQIDICYRYNYFEVFGLDDKAFGQLAEFYGSMLREERNNGENNYS